MFSAKPTTVTTTISAATITSARKFFRNSASSISSLEMYGWTRPMAVANKLTAITIPSFRQYGAMYASARRYCPTGITRGSGVDTVHLVVAHVARAAMLRLLAQRDGALDHMQLRRARARPVHDIANHLHARHFFERRAFAPHDFERRHAHARQIRNGAQPARPVWQALGRRATAVPVQVPDPFPIIRQVAAQPALAPRSEHAPGPFEFRVHLGKVGAKCTDRMMMRRRAETFLERAAVVQDEDFNFHLIAHG